MFWHILQRTIFFELVKIFAMALLAITGIIVMAGIVAEATQRGLSPSQIIMVIPLLIPSFLPYTVPATTLFATCIVYGRLAHDNEILALKAAGVNILYVIWPGVFVGVLMSSLTMAMYYHTIPYSHLLLRKQVMKDVEEYLYTMLRKDNQIKQPNLNYVIHVRHVQGRRLLDAIFEHQNEQGQEDIIARADEAKLEVDLPNKKILVKMRHGQVFGTKPDAGRVFFEERTWPVDLPPNFANSYKPRPADMIWQELLTRGHELDGEIDNRLQMIAQELPKQPQAGPAHRSYVEHLAYCVKHDKLERNSISAELQMRPALSFGCLFFVLVGCAVGIWFGRSDYLSAFITCFLPIVLVYYPVMLCCTNLAKDGKLPPAVALWAANGILALVAPVLFWQLTKH